MRYRLIVEDGEYDADSLLGLIWQVLMHRLSHLMRDGRWRD